MQLLCLYVGGAIHEWSKSFIREGSSGRGSRTPSLSLLGVRRCHSNAVFFWGGGADQKLIRGYVLYRTQDRRRSKGGGLFENQTGPPSRSPKFFEHVFPPSRTLADGEPELMGKFFLKKILTPLVYVQNDQCMDHFEVCMLGYLWIPPPGTPAVDRPTHPPASPPPLQTPKRFRTWLGVNIRTGQPPCADQIRTCVALSVQS